MQPQHEANLPTRRQLSRHIGVRLQSASPSTSTITHTIIVPPAPQTPLHPQVAHHHSHRPSHNHLKNPRLYHPPNPTLIISPLYILKSIRPFTPRLRPQNIPICTHAPVDSAHPSIIPTYPEAPIRLSIHRQVHCLRISSSSPPPPPPFFYHPFTHLPPCSDSPPRYHHHPSPLPSFIFTEQCVQLPVLYSPTHGPSTTTFPLYIQKRTYHYLHTHPLLHLCICPNATKHNHLSIHPLILSP